MRTVRCGCLGRGDDLGVAQLGAGRIEKRNNSSSSDETERSRTGPEYRQFLAGCGSNSSPEDARGEVEARGEFTTCARNSTGSTEPTSLTPLSEDQATGLERFELLGKLEGVDVFDMNPVEMTRMGTVDEPIAIYSLVSADGGSFRGVLEDVLCHLSHALCPL